MSSGGEVSRAGLPEAVLFKSNAWHVCRNICCFPIQPLGSLEDSEPYTGGKRKTGKTCSKSDFGSLLTQEREYGEQKKAEEAEPI